MPSDRAKIRQVFLNRNNKQEILLPKRKTNNQEMSQTFDDQIDRLNEIVKKKSMNRSQFCREIGFNAVYGAGILGNHKKLNVLFLAKLVERYPEVNLNWVLTGEGEMLNTESVPPSPDSSTTPDDSVSLESIGQLLKDTLSQLEQQQGVMISHLEKKNTEIVAHLKHTIKDRTQEVAELLQSYLLMLNNYKQLMQEQGLHVGMIDAEISRITFKLQQQ